MFAKTTLAVLLWQIMMTYMRFSPPDKYRIIMILGLFLSFKMSSAQTISATRASIDWMLNDIERFYPNLEYIERKIKTVEIEFGTKRDNARIEKSGKKFIINYTRDGKPESEIEIVRNEFGFDSLFTFHYYLNGNKMHVARKFMNGKYFAIYETLDPEGRTIKLQECQETNQTNDFRFFKLGRQTVLFSESYQYELLNPEQERKKYLNDNNLVYKEGIIYYDKKHKVKEMDFSFSTTGIRENITNVYDEQGRLTENHFSSDAAGDLRETTRYTYESKQLIGQKYYRNNVLKNERFYFYNKENGLLESILSKSAGDYNIEIFNISIQFYE